MQRFLYGTLETETTNQGKQSDLIALLNGYKMQVAHVMIG